MRPLRHRRSAFVPPEPDPRVQDLELQVDELDTRLREHDQQRLLLEAALREWMLASVRDRRRAELRRRSARLLGDADE